MEGGRFGLGIVAGLVLAFAVVAATAAVYPASTPASPPMGGLVTGSPTTTTVSATTTAPSGVVFTVSTPSAPYGSSANHQNLLSGLNSTSAGLTAGTAVPGVGFSSDLAAANQLPAPSRALLLAPVLAAFVLGALLYRASGRSQRDSDEQEVTSGP